SQSARKKLAPKSPAHTSPAEAERRQTRNPSRLRKERPDLSARPARIHGSGSMPGEEAR
uniref:Uncharacterized protein n=1 Tax=Aegilops tauschii subsp. strangulata TaxID=200361 RepID=A0A452ZTT1_AEGTS